MGLLFFGSTEISLPGVQSVPMGFNLKHQHHWNLNPNTCTTLKCFRIICRIPGQMTDPLENIVHEAYLWAPETCSFCLKSKLSGVENMLSKNNEQNKGDN